jgi:hypothetical protein
MDEALGAEKGERTANRARLPFRILWPDAGGDQQETPLSVASIKRYRPATCVTCGSEGVLGDWSACRARMACHLAGESRPRSWLHEVTRRKRPIVAIIKKVQTGDMCTMSIKIDPNG